MAKTIATKTFQAYFEIDQEIKELEAKKKSIKTKILENFQKNDIEKAEVDFGTFYIRFMPVYKYTKKTITLEAEMKQQKKDEIENGKAKVVDEKESLVFRARKEA